MPCKTKPVLKLKFKRLKVPNVNRQSNDFENDIIRTFEIAAADRAMTCTVRLSPGWAYNIPAACAAEVVTIRIIVCRTIPPLERVRYKIYRMIV